jgi:hypothetical protein
MANNRRKIAKELIERAGLSTKDFKGTWHRARDFNVDDLKKEISHIKKTGQPSIQKSPSDVRPEIREKYRETFEPKKRVRIEDPTKIPEPPPRQLPPAQIPDGSVVVLWKDITKRGRTSRYPNALKEIKSLKKAMKGQDPEAVLAYIREMLQKDDGKIGDVEIKIYRNDEELRQIKKEYRGWQVIYNGKGRTKRDLLIGLAAVVTGVYNLALTKAAAAFFIDQIKKIHPTNGQWLDDLYKSVL